MPKKPPKVPIDAHIAAYYMYKASHGDIGVGDWLPGTKAMAERWDTNETNVRKALRLLENWGWIRRETASYPVFIKGRDLAWREARVVR